MPFSGDLPWNPTALRKMIVDLGITPDVSGNPNAYRKQLENHYDAHPVAVPVQPTVPLAPVQPTVPTAVPPVHAPSRPTVALVRSYVNHAVNTASWRTGDRRNTPHVVPNQQIAAPAVVPSNPTNAPRTAEEVLEENRRLVASHQGNLNNELAYINSVWTPSYSDGYYWISKNATDHLPYWGYGGYVPSYDKWPSNHFSAPQWEFDQMSYAVNNFVSGRRNSYQNAIDAANSKAQAEIDELLASQRAAQAMQTARHKNNLDNDYKNNVNSSKAIQRSVLKKIFSSSQISDLTFDPYAAILTHRTSKYAI